MLFLFKRVTKDTPKRIPTARLLREMKKGFKTYHPLIGIIRKMPVK